MTDRPFEYDVSLFELCALKAKRLRSSSSAQLLVPAQPQPQSEQREEEGKDEDSEEACRVLWQGHDRHYGHNRTKDTKEEQQQRLERFVQNVAFVQEFNSPQQPLLVVKPQQQQQQHDVSLNQFADWLPSELPFTTTTLDHQTGSFVDTDTAWDHMWDASVDPASVVWDDTNDGSHSSSSNSSSNNNNNNGRNLVVDRPVFVRLEEESSIRRFAPTQTQPWLLNRKRRRRRPSHDKDHTPEPKKDKTRKTVLYKHRGREVSVAVKPKHEKDGHFMKKKQHDLSSTQQQLRHGRGHDGLKDQDKQSEYATDKIGIIPILDDDSGDDGDKFATYLNWNTKDNPDGVTVVHPVFDQGRCGSCWAIAATGTLEASVSRNAAYHTYADRLETKQGPAQFASFSDEQRRAVRSTARDAEEAALDVAKLSIQELIDCDTNYDEGCTGGNPLLAFYFIHRHGLASTEDYPYIGAPDKCHTKRINHPIATVKTWGVLTPNHEDNMELVIRYLGPLAVGVNGADPAFLSYKKGIFDSPHCDQRPNHALLIVGYGQDILDNGTKVKYWIARNSWGKGWGEEGYVRIKRGSGKVGQKGVCGIAKGPSVALGGALLPSILLVNRNKKPFSPFYGYSRTISAESSTQVQIRQEHTYCGLLGLDHYSTCAHVQV
mmetsp:Transcript_25842/g.46793  ORF Transcript_25842/g.46793 Transcript_25842/m.46793 type:complete len:659 (-) Transcript_25842:1518-3494(-)